MVHQIIFNLLLFLMGYIFLLIFKSIDTWWRSIISYVIGLALWGILSTVIMSCQIKLTIYSVLVAYFGIILICYYSKNIEFNFESLKKDMAYCVTSCIIILLLTVIFYNYNFITVQKDSYRYILIGHAIEEMGYFNKNFVLWAYAAKSRMAFLPLIYAGSKMLNIDFFYTLFPITAVTLLLLVPSIIYKLSCNFQELKIARVAFCALSVLTLLSIPAFWYHAFYVNNFLLVSVYFTISFASILFFEKEDTTDWLVLSAICLATTTLQRTEMSLAASIVIAMLLGCANLTKKRYAVFLSIFVTIALSWHLYQIILLGTGRHYHGWGLIQLIIFTLYILSYLVIHFDVTRLKIARNITNICLYSLCIILVLVLKVFPSEVCTAISKFINITARPLIRHDWGIFWLILYCFALTDIMVLKSEKGMYFLKFIVMFFIYRILLYSIPISTTRIPNHWVSGNSILMHILPMCIIYMFYLGIYSFGSYRDKHIVKPVPIATG